MQQDHYKKLEGFLALTKFHLAGDPDISEAREALDNCISEFDALIQQREPIC